MAEPARLMTAHLPHTRREYAAGLLMLAFGLLGLVEGQRLGIGTLTDMGPGFVPVALGAVLCVVAPIIVLIPDPTPALPGHDTLPEAGLDRRGAACILAGAVGFIVLGHYAGLLAATFWCVFVAALGDRTTSLRGAAGLALAITIFGCALFAYVLQLPIPLVAGWR